MTDFADIRARAHALQEQLRAEGYADDDVLQAIESETDLLRTFDRVAERIDQDQRSAVIARARARRLEDRADRNLEFLDYLMRTMGIEQKLERPLATVYYQQNPPKLELEEEQLGQYWLTAVPDKPRITKALKAGDAIPGAKLTQGRSLRIRTA